MSIGLDWFYPRDPVEALLILYIAIILDLLYPRHTGFLYKIHPVHIVYVLALKFYQRSPKTKLRGVLIWFSAAGSHILLYAAILYVASVVNRFLWIAASIYILKTSAALRLLIDHVRDTENCLRRRDIKCARESVSGIVRRDVSRLGEGHVASAAIESLYENLVDSFVSPLIYYVVLGPLGALLQRLANTMDGALGYKENSFKEIGWFSARVDTILNYLPARLTALLEVLTCPLIGGDLGFSWRIYLRYRRSVESINAGHPMSVASGCLRVKLEKLGYYVIGREFDLPSHRDIHRGIVHVYYVVAVFLLLLSISIILIQVVLKVFGVLR